MDKPKAYAVWDTDKKEWWNRFTYRVAKKNVWTTKAAVKNCMHLARQCYQYIPENYEIHEYNFGDGELTVNSYKK